MVFDRLRQAFSGQPVGPSPLIRDALLPIRAVSESLWDRSAWFVHDGSDSEVLLELDAARQPDLDRLMLEPAKLVSWRRPLTDDQLARLKRAGLGDPPAKEMLELRSRWYRGDATPEQFLRMAYLLAAIGTGPNRTVEGVPRWLTALTNDLTIANNKGAFKYLNWPPERMADLLRLDGCPDAQAPTVLFWAMLEHEPAWSSTLRPHQWPGIDNWLLGFGHLVDPGAASRLTAEARTAIAERAAADPRVAHALAPVIVRLAADKAKGVRQQAVAALRVLTPQTQAAVLPPVLATLPSAQSAELVEYLAGTDEGAALLESAVADGARFGTAVQKAKARREALQSADQGEQSLIVPPFIPLPDQLDEGRTLAELRRLVDARISRDEGSEHPWAQRRLKGLRSLTDGDLMDAIRVAEGIVAPHPTKLAEGFAVHLLAGARTGFNPVHLLRLDVGKVGSQHRYGWAISACVDQITDLRQVEDAFRRTGQSSEAFEQVPVMARVSAWSHLEPEVTWPWFAHRQDVLQAWLAGNANDITDALAVLEAFPSLPVALQPAVAAVALGDSRRARPLAQALLARHGAAGDLALQGLADGKGEVRAASAAWLASLGDPDGVAALRSALAKESREVPRAAMLTALQRLGDDVSADLGADALLAEAVKGLKAKLPPALDWFGFDQLPALAWADLSPVDPRIPRWWVVLANKVKNPDGSGLIDLYLGTLAADSAAALGRFALTSWIAQDVRHPAEDESRQHAAQAGQHRWQWAQDNLKRSLGNAQARPELVQWQRERAAIPLEQHVREAYAEHQSTYLGSAAANRGVLALTTRMPGIELANAVQAYIRNHGARRAQVDALIHPLFANGQPAAVQLLLSISRRFKQASVQATAGALVERLADQRGWTPDELADRTIPTAGFDADGLLRLDFGSREFTGRATPAGTIELANAEGAPIKALPAARAADDEELVKAAKKQLTTSRKELKAVLAQQTARLYEAMCAGRTWTGSDWREFLLDHPLVGQFVGRLVWFADADAGPRLFRPTEDGGLIDVEDDPVDLPDDARVGLAHRVIVGDAAAAAWTGHLADYEVTPLFDQFANGLPAVDRSGDALTDLKGHLTDTFSYRGVATKRGYQRGAAEDGAWFEEYTKPFTAAGLSAVQEFTGSYLPEENIACATVGLSFRGPRNRTVALSEVPDVLLAECYADFAALAALGPFDPDWQKKAGL